MVLLLTGLFGFGDVDALKAAGESDRLLARFRAEARPAWKITESADEWPGTKRMKTKISTYTDGKLLKTEAYSALTLFKPGCHVYRPEQSRDVRHVIYGKNVYYSFKIANFDANNKYSLDEFRMHGQQGYADISSSDLVQYLKPNSYSFIPFGGQMSELIDNPRFKVLRAEEVEGHLVRVHFNTTIRIPGKEMGVTGWMDFDPDNAWALQSSQLTSSFGSTSKILKTFSKSPRDGYRPCVTWETITLSSSKGKKRERIHHTEFEMVDPSSPADEVFRLPYYGLPEPMGVKPLEPSRTWIWLIAGMVAAAALSLLFVWLKRRRARTDA